LDDADDLLLLAGVVEERAVARLHRLQIAARLEVAHAGPRLALGALLDLMLPTETVGLGLQQPVGHGMLLSLSGIIACHTVRLSRDVTPPGTAASAATRSRRRRSRFPRSPRRRRRRSASR